MRGNCCLKAAYRPREVVVLPVSCSVAAMKMRGVTVFKISIHVLVGRIKFAVFDGLQSDYRGHAEDILG